MNKTMWIGSLLAITFVVLSAGRDAALKLEKVLAASQHEHDPQAAALSDNERSKGSRRQMPSYLLVVLAFLPGTALAGAALAVKPSLRPNLPTWRGVRWNLFLLNVTTVVSWLTFFESIDRISAPLCVAIVAGGMPLFMLLLGWFFDQRAIAKVDILAALVVAGGVLLMAFAEFRGTQADLWSHLGNVLLAGVSSFFAAANNWVAGRLRKVKFGPLPIFASRFWLLLVVAFALAYVDDVTERSRSMSDWMFGLFIGLAGFAAPVLCNQGAIDKLGHEIPTFLAAFHPACVWLLLVAGALWVDSGTPTSLQSLLGVTMVTAGICWSIYVELQRKKLTPNTPPPADSPQR